MADWVQGERLRRSGTVIGPGGEQAANDVDGNVFRNRRNAAATLLLVRNADSNPHDLTVELGRVVDGVRVQPRTVAIPANRAVLFGPFTADYEQLVGGTASAVVVQASSSELKLQVLYLQKE